jgi:tRNA(Arg) A34 adenosine deaminase TadA
MTTYDDLGAAWQHAVEQAWESFAAGSLGIGAVITAGSGEVVSAGRNRIGESTGPPGRLYGTRLAHAEMDVLAGLGSDIPRDIARDLVLWTTLEPCLLCAGGIVLCNIPVVHYAATDPLWDGADRVDGLNDFLASRWPERTGPVDGPLATFGALLPLLWFLRTRGEDGIVARTYAKTDPQLLDHARAHTRTASDLVADGATPREALTALVG